MANPHAPEKNLPAENKENPKQKILILIAAGIALVALLVLGAYQYFQSRDDFAGAQNQFIKALQNSDAAVLKKLAAEEIQIGTAEGENSQSLTAEQMIPRLIEYAKNAEWSPQSDQVEQIRLLSAKNKGLQALFRKDQDTWKWVGLLLVSADDVQSLSFGTDTAQGKGKYKEIQSDEATGSEEELKQ